MTASRTCRACGTDLAPDVRWCLRCFEPVRQLTPRAPQLPRVELIEPKTELPTSRWKRGATTFGPAGRLTITAVVLLFAPRSFGVVAIVLLWPAYLVVAGLVLRSTWRRDVVDTDPGAARAEPPTRRPTPARSKIPPATVVIWVVIAAVVVGVAIASLLLGDMARVAIDLVVLLAASLLLLRWLVRT